MKEYQRDLLALIKNAMNGTEYGVSEEFDWEKAYRFAVSQQLISLIYYGALRCPGFKESGMQQTFSKANAANVSISEWQLHAFGEIEEAFEKARISFLPLKGACLKSMYPYPEMRAMSDLDIFIKTEEYDKIKVIMTEMGYTEGSESDHELHWHNDRLCIEFHKRLIPSYNKDYYAYYRDGWAFAERIRDNSCEYTLKDEDFFIYIFTHFAKHYRDCGAGVKYVVDFYAFFKTHPNVDSEYIKTELRALGLDNFYENVVKLLKIWFGDEESDDISDFLTEKIFTRGVYGTKEDSVRSDGLKISKKHKNAKLHYFFSVVFPSFSGMKTLYPILKKLPFLLPFCWVIRWFKALFTKSKNIKRELTNLKKYDAGAIAEYEEELNFVGLDYNFKD